MSLSVALPMDISDSLKGLIGDKKERSMPDATPSKSSFPLILLILSSISDKFPSGDPPHVLRMEDNLSLIIGLCFAKMLDHFLDTSSLVLTVP